MTPKTVGNETVSLHVLEVQMTRQKEVWIRELTCTIQGYQQIQSQPRSAKQTTVQHHPFQQDNCPKYNHVVAA